MLFIDYLKQLEEKIYSFNNNKTLHSKSFEYKKQNFIFWKLIEKIIEDNNININEKILQEFKRKIFLYNFFNDDIVNNYLNIKRKLIFFDSIDLNDVDNFVVNLLIKLIKYNEKILNDVKTILSNEFYLINLIESDNIFSQFMKTLIVKIFDDIED